MVANLRVKTKPGQCETDLTVFVTLKDGGHCSFFMDKSLVQDSKIRVWVYQKVEGAHKVKLPRESFERGRYVTVPDSEIELICDDCQTPTIEDVTGVYPFSIDHYICTHCDGTFNT